MDHIIEMARELGKEIQKDARYLRLVETAFASENDKELQDLIARFNDLRTQINMEMIKDDKDQDKLSAMDKEFKEVYSKVVALPSMVAYNDAKAEVERMINFVNQIVLGASNGENPDLIEESSGCSGDCSSCGTACH